MINQLYTLYLKSTGVSTDTRTLHEGNIWFALKGPNFNANQFAEKALEMGASTVVIDDAKFKKDDRFFLVEDGLMSLQALATHHRRKFNIPFIGITGSNGKTTTKELIRDVLATKFKVLATKGNLNNHIGVPLTLLGLDESIEIAIIEMGANHQKEIAALSAIAEPTHGMITNIGKAHLEGFGGLEGVFKGKTELYEFMQRNEGTLFVNSRNERLLNKAKDCVEEVITYPDTSDNYSAELLGDQPYVQIRTSKGNTISTQLTGAYNFENICAALCIGQYFGVQELRAIEALEAYQPENNRSQILRKGSNLIFMDAYNANPTSMSLSLKNFAAKKGKNVAIIGDMFELGAEAEKEHAAMGQLTNELNLEQVIFSGELMKHAFAANPQGKYFPKKEELRTYLKDHPIQNANVLIKGSRGMSLETLLEML